MLLGEPGCHRFIVITFWLFNIAMENSPFIEDFPINTSIYKGFSMAMLVITRWYCQAFGEPCCFRYDVESPRTSQDPCPGSVISSHHVFEAQRSSDEANLSRLPGFTRDQFVPILAAGEFQMMMASASPAPRTLRLVSSTVCAK